jgi:uncharacterized protein YkwD
VKGRIPLILSTAVLTVFACAGPGAASSAAAMGLQGNLAAKGAPAATAQRTAAPTGGELVAPLGACPDQEDLTAPTDVQEQTMACMVDFARRQAGLPGLVGSPILAQSAQDKSLDVLRCDEFSHFACGRDFTYWMKETGYTSTPCWRVGENLAWGTGGYGTVRSIFRAWMNSPEHRANILGEFAQTGISLRVGTLDGQGGARVWTQHFGSHCDAP